jgi:transcriptional regulator with XRE-family HTH domain
MAGEKKTAKIRKKTTKSSIALDRSFAPNLRRCREAAGLTQEELAERAEVHRTQISLLERALRNPGYDMLTRLAGALEMDAGDLFAGTVWRRPKDGHEGCYDYDATG